MSNIALGAQNAFGDVPVIGSILRGPAANRIVNYNRDFAAEQDKKAMGSADNWVKGLSNEQLSSLATTGSYINDSGAGQLFLTLTSFAPPLLQPKTA